MDHAEAAPRVADLALEPARLAAFDTDMSPEGIALRAHVAGCPACGIELRTWRSTWALLVDDDHAAVDRMEAPGSLRAETLAAIAADSGASSGATSGATRSASIVAPPPVMVPSARTRWRRMPWLLAAAALVIAIGAAGLGLDRAAQLDRVRGENAGLGAATIAMSRVLATDTHWTTSLRTADGRADGTVAWTADQIVVVAADLPSLPSGGSYRCWVEQAGVRTSIGAMAVSGSTGFWSAPMDGWGPLMAKGAQFGVSILSADGSSTPVLVGTL